MAFDNTLSKMGQKVGSEFKAHRLRLESLESTTFKASVLNSVDASILTIPDTVNGFKAYIHGSNGTDVHSTEIIVNHANGVAYSTEYASITSNTELFALEANISAGNIELYALISESILFNITVITF